MTYPINYFTVTHYTRAFLYVKKIEGIILGHSIDGSEYVYVVTYIYTAEFPVGMYVQC